MTLRGEQKTQLCLSLTKNVIWTNKLWTYGFLKRNRVQKPKEPHTIKFFPQKSDRRFCFRIAASCDSHVKRLEWASSPCQSLVRLGMLKPRPPASGQVLLFSTFSTVSLKQAALQTRKFSNYRINKHIIQFLTTYRPVNLRTYPFCSGSITIAVLILQVLHKWKSPASYRAEAVPLL